MRNLDLLISAKEQREIGDKNKYRLMTRGQVYARVGISGMNYSESKAQLVKFGTQFIKDNPKIIFDYGAFDLLLTDILSMKHPQEFANDNLDKVALLTMS